MTDRDRLPPTDNNKRLDAVSGCNTGNDFLPLRAPMPHEITAEWTVNAQLKFARAGETVKKKISTNDIISPVRVLYKWSTPDDNAKASGPQNEDDTYLQDPMKSTKQSDVQREESFRSTTSSITCGDIGAADSAFSSSNNSNNQQKYTATTKMKNLENNFYGTRCRSTCNIIVTAVADFLSPTDMQAEDNVSVDNPENASESFVINTTAYCTVQPEKSSCSEERKYLNFRDAVCQTSDGETKYSSHYERKPRSSLERRDSRRMYDYRKTAVSDLLRKPDHTKFSNEDNSFMPSQIPSTIQTSKSSSTARVASLIGENAGASKKPMHSDPQKKPRTVHIDVYCTGSEDDDQADAESSSDTDEENRRLDQDSNSTFQTVLENKQMRLRHQRKTDSSLPRRLVENNPTILPNQVSESSKGINIGHALTKSSTAEEIQESKQILFRKHVDDQRAVKLQNLRQKYLRQSSDDTLSFGYPNSSRSTVRDNTCSSISSLLAGQDIAEPSPKETGETEDFSCSLTKSDSFEYENTLDRLRIRQMERLWSRSHSNEGESKLQDSNNFQSDSNNLKSISEATSPEKKSSNSSIDLEEKSLQSKLDVVSKPDASFFSLNDTTNYKFHQTSHFPRNKPGFLQFFGPNLEHSEPIDETLFIQQPQSLAVPVQCDSTLLSANYAAGSQHWKNEKIDNLSAYFTPLLTPSELSRQSSPQPPLSHQTIPSYNKNFHRSGSETPQSTTCANIVITATPTSARRFDMYNRPSSAISETSPQQPPFGYSLEYLDKAKMFGKVVKARKPGHHVGPTKNPSCSCSSCQRWLAERFQIRGRVFSLGEMPILKRPS